MRVRLTAELDTKGKSERIVSAANEVAKKILVLQIKIACSNFLSLIRTVTIFPIDVGGVEDNFTLLSVNVNGHSFRKTLDRRNL